MDDGLIEACRSCDGILHAVDGPGANLDVGPDFANDQMRSERSVVRFARPLLDLSTWQCAEYLGRADTSKARDLALEKVGLFLWDVGNV